MEVKRNRTLGNNIRFLREYFHMSQSEIKRQTGIDNSTISRCEAGEQPINSDHLECLCRLLNSTPNEILGWEKLTYRQVSPDVTNPERFKPDKVGQAPKIEETPVKKPKPKETDKEQIHGILCDLLHETYVKKNHDYGDSFSTLRKKYPILVCIHLAEKLERLNTLIEHPKDAKVNESIEDTLMDLANYCLLELTERNAKR